MVRVVSDQLRELRVAGTELLENGLKHLGLLLNDLAKLLELRVVPQEVQVAKASALSSGGGGNASSSTSSGTCSSSGTSTRATAATSTATPLLSRKIKEVHVAVITCIVATGRLGGSGGGRGRRLALLLLALSVLGDALFRSQCLILQVLRSALTVSRYSTARSGL